MKQLNLPPCSLKIAGKEGEETIFDPVRRKYVKLTPEEWVRQHFIQYLVNHGRYPSGLMGVEVMFRLNKLKRRLDILVHDRKGKPVMIVECKEPDIKIDEKVFEQVITYNRELKVPYIIATNGIVNYACKLREDNTGYDYLNVIPLYEELNTDEQ